MSPAPIHGSLCHNALEKESLAPYDFPVLPVPTPCGPDSWLCARGSLLGGLGDPLPCWGWKQRPALCTESVLPVPSPQPLLPLPAGQTRCLPSPCHLRDHHGSTQPDLQAADRPGVGSRKRRSRLGHPTESEVRGRAQGFRRSIRPWTDGESVGR